MQTFKYVILGGGMVAGYAAQEFAQAGLGPSDVLIVSADSQPPYERPPLSKSFLAGEKTLADTLIQDPTFYADHHIGLMLETVVTAADFDNRVLTTRAGGQIAFEQLLIATGARPRHLEVHGADSPNVFYLRSLDDATRLRGQVAPGRRAVVIGSGFIGMETASVFARRDLEVTMVYPQKRVWAGFFTPEMSEFFQHYYQDQGVRLRPGHKVSGVHCGPQDLSVELDGGERLATDFVVAGVGVEPVVDIFLDTPLELDDGIVVNEFLETNIEGVYAAGDVARWRDVIFKKQRRVEHWDNAVTQGPHAARAMLGRREPYIHVPYFFSDEFDISYEFWGDVAEASDIIYRGDVASGHFSTWWIRDGRIAAAFILNRPDEERDWAQRWIASQEEAPLERLADDSESLAA
jgi:NADPH-dependent 2,4-dienoyl-CoA reductase/sulfur reductase-like enzyme